MEQQSWDIFCSTEPAGALWHGMQLAMGLGKRSNAVRLFTEGVSELSVAVPTVLPDLWMQAHTGLQLCDVRLARLAAPAQCIVQVFGAPIPERYLSRVTTRSSLRTRLMLEACNSPRKSGRPITPLSSPDPFRSVLMQVGDLPSCAGYIKRDKSLPPSGDDAFSLIQARLFKALGLPGDVGSKTISAYVSATSQVPIVEWARMLAAEDEPSVVFVERGHAHDELTEFAGVPALSACHATMQSLTLVFLPPLSWAYADEVISSCDVVVTDALDVAARAAEMGTPVMWAGANEEDKPFLGWYACTASPELQQALAFSNSALSTGRCAAQAWRWYRSLAVQTRGLANQLMQRISRAPNLVDVITAGVGRDSPGKLGLLFAPTRPGRLPGP